MAVRHVVRSRGVVSVEGEGCGWSAISQPTCENRKAFLGLPSGAVDGESCSLRLLESQASVLCGGARGAVWRDKLMSFC